MYIYDVLHKDKVYQSVTLELRALGIKYRPKKIQMSIAAKSEIKSFTATSRDQNTIINSTNRGTTITRIFKTPLSNLPLEVVNLDEGVVVYVPSFVSEAVAFLMKNITQEGLFRKAGSQVRQKEIISRIDNGASINEKHNVIDVANCLKTFFRHLPEPLIPYCFHDLFVRCGMLKTGREKALLMACLLLPVHHLNTLAYLMRFLKNVAKYERENKMSIDNIAKVFGPNIMPLQETTMVAMQSRLDAHLAIVKTLIEKSEQIGILPENIAESIAGELMGSTDIELHGSDPYLYVKYKKKKHRSGSLTRKPHLSASNLNLRMFSGLKKIVGRNNSPTENEPLNTLETSDPCLYSPLSKTAKKRKAESANEISQVKKNSIRDKSPFSRMKTTKNSTRVNLETRIGEKLDKNKKMRLSLDKIVHKGKNKIVKNGNDKYKVSDSPCIERRWSSASNSCTSPKKSVIKRKDSPSLGSLLHETDAKIRLPQLYDDDVFMNADVNLSDDNEDILSQSQVNESAKAKHQRVTAKRRSLSTLLSERSRIKNTSKHRLDSPEKLHDLKMKRTKSIDSILPKYRNYKEDETEYVRVRKSEYEDIKNRVSAIESRISQEFDKFDINSSSDTAVNNVQSEYEKTLEEAGIKSTLSADHLAKQMSRELKIRKSAEHKIFRSPSARKIGTIRRRSQEKPRTKVSRTPSWHSNDVIEVPVLPSTPLSAYTYPTTSPGPDSAEPSCSTDTNARLEYLQEQLQTLINQTMEHTQTPLSDDSPMSYNPLFITTETPKTNTSIIYRTPDTTKYFNHKISELKRSQKTESTKKNHESENWRDAGKYFSVNGSPMCTPVPQTGRASVAKLRTQNAGMVLAKAKLFDSTQEMSSSSRRFARQNVASPQTPPVPPPRHKRKVHHSPKCMNNRRTSIDSEKPSPKRIPVVQNIENEVDLDCKTPHIKKPLMVRTPRSAKIVRRAAVDIKRTPMKAVPIATPKRQSPAIRSRYHQK